MNKEVVVGAKVTAEGDAGTYTAQTNWIGDFWLRGLPEADWTLTIEADGKRKTLQASTKAEDVGLGDLPLS